jgi:MATE family multidrug resistance protein
MGRKRKEKVPLTAGADDSGDDAVSHSAGGSINDDGPSATELRVGTRSSTRVAMPVDSAQKTYEEDFSCTPPPFGCEDPGSYSTASDNAAGRAVARFIGVPYGMRLSTMCSQLARNFIPAAGTTLLFFANQTITMMFVGRLLGVEALAAYSVGQSVFNVAGISLAQGFATGLDTLCSQSYGRHKSGPELGEILQRGMLVCLAISIPIIAFFELCDPMMIFFFGRRLGPGVAQFLHWAPLYLVFMTLYQCLQKALQAQGLPEIPLISACVSVVLCPFFNMWVTPHGIPGGVMAMTLSTGTIFFVMLIIARFHPKVILFHASWPSRHALDADGIRRFMDVAIPSLFSICSEWWAFEVLVALAAQVGDNEVAAFTIAFNVVLIAFAIPQGMAIAVGVLSGNCLGAYNPLGARAFTRLAILMTAGICVVNLFILALFAEHFFLLYTVDDTVLGLLRNILPFLLVFHCGDSAQTVLQGAFRGVGRQDSSARIVLVALWLIGVPCSFLYVVKFHWGLPGILLGSITGFCVEVPLLVSEMACTWDWEQLAIDASTEVMPCSPTTSEMMEVEELDSAGSAFPTNTPSYGTA